MTGRHALRVTLPLLLLAVVPCRVAANTSPGGRLSIEAKLDRDRIVPGETATLTIEVRSEGLNLPDVPLSHLSGVAVERAGTTQNFSIINGRVTRTSTTEYRLIPRSEGVVTIPPLRVAVGNERAETSPLTLTVSRTAAPRTPKGPLGGNLPPGTAPSGDPEIFVKATVDRSRVFWNQQVTLRLRLYSRVDVIGDVEWKPPSADGFWTEGLGPARNGLVKVNGTEYSVMEIASALFPTRTGTLTVGQARVRCRVARVIQPPDPWSMLAVPDVVPEDVTLNTDPVTISVDPLPRGAPPGFQGAVGDFRLALRVDGLTAAAFDPVIARATIEGSGNIATVRDPEIHATGASRQYVVGSSSRMDRSQDVLRGSREIDVAFVADQPGSLEIAPVRFSWFNPETGAYRTQTSEGVTVRILPAAQGGKQGGVATGGAAIAALRTGQGPRGTLTLDPPAGAKAMFGFFATAFTSAIAVGAARRKKLRDPRHVRSRALQTLLDRSLARAASLAGSQPANAAAIAEQALLAGAGIRHDIDLAGLARPERRDRLIVSGATEAEVVSLEALLDSLGAIAYAPPETRGADARQAIAAVRDTLERYRKEIEA